MKAEKIDPAIKALRWALVAAAALYLIMYLVIALMRIRYPFELEWMEGGSLDHVRRVLMGEKLYVRPSLEFIPFIYTPLYYFVSAAVSSVIGLGFTSLRLVSLLSSIGCFTIIFLIIKRETRDSLSGFIGAGMFAATFRISGAWFDIARADSLFLFLFLLGCYVFRSASRGRSYVIAGLVISLAALAKQPTLVMALPLVLYSLIPRRGPQSTLRPAFFAGTVAVVVGTATLALNHIHGGWFTYYVWELPRSHQIVRGALAGFWVRDLLAEIPLAGMMAALYLGAGIRASFRQRDFFYVMLAVGMVGGAWSSRLHSGGYSNVLMPAYAVISVLFGLAFHRASAALLYVADSKRRLIWVFIGIQALTQFALLAYNPARQIPTKADAEAGRRIVEMISRVEGDVFIPEHGYLARLAGKRSAAHRMAIDDVLRGDTKGAGPQLHDEIISALAQGTYGAVMLDSYWWPYVGPKAFEEYYIKQVIDFPDDKVFRCLTGARIRPTWIYLPRDHFPQDR
jgi:4-amino-4-deoxy-L-arabinose transferase-like glycosyltransferase